MSSVFTKNINGDGAELGCFSEFYRRIVLYLFYNHCVQEDFFKLHEYVYILNNFVRVKFRMNFRMNSCMDLI